MQLRVRPSAHPDLAVNQSLYLEGMHFCNLVVALLPHISRWFGCVLCSEDSYYAMSCNDGGQFVGLFPYVEQLRVDSSAGDAFQVTTYTNQTYGQYFSACSMSSADGCEVSTDAKCGYGIKSDLVVALKCKNPSADCNLRLIIELNCTELLPTNSSSSSGDSRNEEVTVPTDSSTSDASKIDLISWKTTALSCASLLGLYALFL